MSIGNPWRIGGPDFEDLADARQRETEAKIAERGARQSQADALGRAGLVSRLRSRLAALLGRRRAG